jgi:hypothetical protein
MQSEPLITWPKPIYELLEFVAAFLAIGPLGFRYGVARPTAGSRRAVRVTVATGF